jgi:hypothetical protein
MERATRTRMISSGSTMTEVGGHQPQIHRQDPWCATVKVACWVGITDPMIKDGQGLPLM